MAVQVGCLSAAEQSFATSLRQSKIVDFLFVGVSTSTYSDRPRVCG